MRKGVVLTAEEVRELVGYPIVLEGGIAQGKTTMARALARLLRKYGVKTMCCPEPTDLEALAEFMKYQVKPPKVRKILQNFSNNCEGRAGGYQD